MRQFFRIGERMINLPEFWSILWTNHMVLIELIIEVFLLMTMIALSSYFFHKVYRYARGASSRFPVVEISPTLKAVWILMALPLLLFVVLWGQQLFGPPIGFVGDFRNWAEKIRFLLIFLSYNSLLWYPFYLGLGIYFSYWSLVKGKKNQALGIASFFTYVGLIESGLVLFDLWILLFGRLLK